MSKYILITGGELFNKGAQAMTYITADYIAEKHPDCEAVVFSEGDARRPKEFKAMYKFEILPFPGFGESLSLQTGLLKKRYLKRENGKNFERYREIFKNAVAMIDISGYALGSNWKKSTVNGYLRRISLANHFNIPVYLMPQSFGPFDFEGLGGKIMDMRIKKALKKVRCIMARETEGYDLLTKKYRLKNVIKTFDLVLQNKGIDLGNVFHELPDMDIPQIEGESVAIIPNGKNEKYGNKDAVMSLYKSVIQEILQKGKRVYLIYHAVEDLKICKAVKNEYFHDNDNVAVIEKELSSIEFGHFVSGFSFVVASRYHSVVHSYKEGVPAVILGWAIKYRELSAEFSQDKFCFDVRGALNEEKVLDAIRYMCDNHENESKIIREKLITVQKNNVYDLISIK